MSLLYLCDMEVTLVFVVSSGMEVILVSLLCLCGMLCLCSISYDYTTRFGREILMDVSQQWRF